MTNNTIGRLVAAYVALTVLTLVALGVLSSNSPDQAPQEAWVHAVIVAVLSVLLLARTRAALGGSAGGQRAVRIVAAVLLVADLVEAAVPGLFPVWMRVECVVVAVLMGAVLVAAQRSWGGHTTARAAVTR